MVARLHAVFPPGMRAALDRLQDLVSQLGSSWTIELDMATSTRAPYPTIRPRRGAAPRQPTNAQVLGWFSFGTTKQPARPILEVDDRARAYVFTAIRERFTEDLLTGRTVNLGAAMMVGARAWKDVVEGRLAHDGGDMALAPLSAAWARRKDRLGLRPERGQASGQLLAAVRKARPVARRTR